MLHFEAWTQIRRSHLCCLIHPGWKGAQCHLCNQLSSPVLQKRNSNSFCVFFDFDLASFDILLNPNWTKRYGHQRTCWKGTIWRKHVNVQCIHAKWEVLVRPFFSFTDLLLPAFDDNVAFDGADVDFHTLLLLRIGARKLRIKRAISTISQPAVIIVIRPDI